MTTNKNLIIWVLVVVGFSGWFLNAYQFFSALNPSKEYFPSFSHKNSQKREFVESKKNQNVTRQRVKDQDVFNYKFTSPLLDCDDSTSNITNAIIKEALQTTKEIITQKLATKEAAEIAVYFRELNDGPWFGIDEDSNFLPGSLLKVPLLISVLKKSEQNPRLLKKEIVYKKDDQLNIKQHYMFGLPLEVGKKYLVEDLLNKMIEKSDNEAANLLLKSLTYEEISDSYTDLGLHTPDSAGVSTRTYASFFRILYNASYLSKQNSEYALDLLSKTDFLNGLAAGLPDDIVVAHKFGEKGIQGSDIVQLHDCGIVYYKTNPYILCVMTKGKDFDILSQIIAQISRNIYKVVSENYDN